MLIKKGTFTVRFMDEDRTETFNSIEDAKQAASVYVGNSSYNKPFMREETYLYGPGDGTTTVMIREDVEFAK